MTVFDVTCGRRSEAGYECTDDAGHRGDCTWPVDRIIDGVAYRVVAHHRAHLVIRDGVAYSNTITITYAEVPDPPERP